MPASRFLRRPLLPAIAAIGVAYCLLALLLVLIDPFDIYPWGITPALKTDGDYTPGATENLVAAVAKSPAFNTFWVGASTGRLYTSRLMAELLPGTRLAFNLGYDAPGAADRAAVFRELRRVAVPHRVVVEADWTYILPKAVQRTSPGFPLYLYDDVWWNDVRTLTMENVRLSWAALHGRPLWLPAWSRIGEDAAYQDRYRFMQGDGPTADLRAYIARNKHSINTPSTLSCTGMDAISEDLAPFARAMSARGAEVDVVLPTYSWAFYYYTGSPDPRSESRPSLLNDLLLLRRCLVDALDDIPHVRIFAFDNIPGLASDFRNYFDPVHLYNFEANRYILRSIAEGQHILSGSNVEAEIAQLRAHVTGYEFTSDKVWAPEQ